MDDSLLMNVDKSLDEMVEVVLKFCLGDPLTTLHHLVEGVVAAQLKDYVDVLAVFEDVVKEQDVFVLERFMDFDFGD